MDGYFPSELQQRFPDGVPFEVRLCSSYFSLSPIVNAHVPHEKFFVQVHDMRHEEFVTRLPWDTFPGEGKAVRGEKDGLPGLFCT